MQVPDEADWTTDLSEMGLDEKYAFDHFHGKTMAEAIRLFEENSLHYQEDLHYLPPRIFAYYLKAFISYLLSDASKADSDGANCFISLIDLKAEHEPEILGSSWPEIEPVLDRLVRRQDDFFEADRAIYGDFRRGFIRSFYADFRLRSIPRSLK